MSNQYDAAVVGAGVFGAWTALQLARSGARVLLLDQHGPGNSRSSSGGETRIIRMCYGPDEIYTRSAMRSLDLWRGFSSEIGQALFQKTGVLLTSSPKDPYLLDTRETLTRVGYRFEWLDHAALSKRFPAIVFKRGAAAVYEPDSGILMARKSVQAVVEAAQRAGVHYERECAQTFTGGVLRTNGGDFHARTLVFACGPWLPNLFPKVLAGRIWPTRQPVFFFGAPSADQRFEAPQMPVWIAFREGAYSIPDCDGRGFKLALDKHGPPFDPETGERKITPLMLTEARAVLRNRFPSLRDAPLLEARVCQYENTSNGDFLIDRHPEFENVWLVGGGSGHGFKHGPFVGQYVTQQILGTGVAEPRFSLASKNTRQHRAVY